MDQPPGHGIINPIGGHSSSPTIGASGGGKLGGSGGLLGGGHGLGGGGVGGGGGGGGAGKFAGAQLSGNNFRES